MIAKSYILRNLNEINTLYNGSPSVKKSLFYSKLAILELCGWIEESMDDIIKLCANRNLKEPDNLTLVQKEIIKKNFGFEYEKNFRQMLLKILGIINLEKIEKKLDPVKIQQLEAALGTLKTLRNSAAHTHIKGVTRILDSPSVTINRFYIVYDGLKNIENKLREARFNIK